MGENEKAPEFLESWTLAAIDMWINMGIIDVPAMILHNMEQEELINNGINPFNEMIKNIKIDDNLCSDTKGNARVVKPTSEPKFEKLAINVVNTMKALRKRNLMPRIIVSSEEIHRLPGITKTGAEA